MATFQGRQFTVCGLVKSYTYSRRYLLECLARDLLKLDSFTREGFLTRWEKRHGKASMEKLHMIIRQECDKESVRIAKALNRKRNFTQKKEKMDM